MRSSQAARPRIRPDLVLVTVHGTPVVYDPRRNELFEVRSDVAALWQLLDGSNTVGQLAAELAQAGPHVLGDAKVYLRGMLAELDRSEFLAPSVDVTT
jgi:hypothetical protein